jgi:hypothetical protein
MFPLFHQPHVYFYMPIAHNNQLWKYEIERKTYYKRDMKNENKEVRKLEFHYNLVHTRLDNMQIFKLVVAHYFRMMISKWQFLQNSKFLINNSDKINMVSFTFIADEFNKNKME